MRAARAGLRQPFEPFMPGGCHVPNTNMYRPKPGFGAETLETVYEEMAAGGSYAAAVAE